MSGSRSAGTPTIVIADDHPIVLAGLQGVLGARFSILAAVADGTAALEAITALNPDIALLDLTMPDRGALEIVQELTHRRRRTRPVIFAARMSDPEIYEAVYSGVAGILLKSAVEAQLIECLDTVAAGNGWMAPGLVEPAIARENERRARWRSLETSLTPRELEIAHLMATGVPNKEIAYRLGVSDGTTKVHIGNIFRKLQITTRVELCLLIAGHVELSGKLPSIHRKAG